MSTFVIAVFVLLVDGDVTECLTAGAEFFDPPLRARWLVEGAESTDASSWEVTVTVQSDPPQRYRLFVGPGTTASGRQSALLVRGIEAG